jgi:hypothetical protein
MSGNDEFTFFAFRFLRLQDRVEVIHHLLAGLEHGALGVEFIIGIFPGPSADLGSEREKREENDESVHGFEMGFGSGSFFKRRRSVTGVPFFGRWVGSMLHINARLSWLWTSGRQSNSSPNVAIEMT